MSWNKDNGKIAKGAAEEALIQANRAEQASDYIDEKQPLIDEFTGEQTNLQAQIDDLVLQIGTGEVERPINTTLLDGYYGFNHGTLMPGPNDFNCYRIDIDATREFRVTNSTLSGEVRAVMLEREGVVAWQQMVNINDVFEVPANCTILVVNISKTTFPTFAGFGINEINYVETVTTLNEKIVELENKLNILSENASNEEIIQARDDFPTLNGRLTAYQEDLTLIKSELSIEAGTTIGEVERPTNIPVAGGFYGTSHGLLVTPENAAGWFHIKIDIGTSRKFKVISPLIGTVRVVMLRAIGVVIEARVINVNEIFEAHEDAAHISINIQTPNAVPPTTATTVFPNANGFSINEIVFAEAGITPVTLKERVVELENRLNDFIENGTNNPEPTTKTMKILMLGNSFALDALQHLYDMAHSAGIKLVLGISYDANGGLAGTWTKVQNNTATDSYHKWTEAGYVVATGRTLNSAVIDEDWDIITYQQVSGSSGNYVSFQPSLNNIHNYVRGIATNANVKFGLHMTWAYATGSSNLAGTIYPTQTAMYEAITGAYLQAMQAMNFDILIPSGTAIQNARSNPYLRAIGTDLTRDGYHLNEGVGRYIAALTVFETLLAPYYKKDMFTDVTFFPTINGGTRSLAFLAKRAAKNAVLNPFKITNL